MNKNNIEGKPAHISETILEFGSQSICENCVTVKSFWVRNNSWEEITELMREFRSKHANCENE